MEVIDRLIFMVVFLVRVNILKGGYFFETELQKNCANRSGLSFHLSVLADV